ncbi:MAG: MFS transporter, partial [Gallionella sp.]|nr:MFS transporter [Gallionella sp.]
FYLFIAHIFTDKKPFIEPELFKDRNFSLGLIAIFIIGIVLLASMALLPPFMQSLMGYPVIDVGYLLAPRGIGTMLGMFMVGKLSSKADPRRLILFGLFLTILSLWEMMYFNTDITGWQIVRNGILQGLGLGLVFVPLSTITFATLARHYRDEGTALFSLMRNIGSSIGISVVITELAHNTQANHAAFSDYITPFSVPLRQAAEAGMYDTGTEQGLMAINGEVTRQAATLAYLQDFRLMMWVTLCAVPLILLLRSPRKQPTPVDVHEAME